MVQPVPQSESESDNATEGVSWKARDLWSAPVEWSNHEMQERKSNEDSSLRLALREAVRLEVRIYCADGSWRSRSWTACYAVRIQEMRLHTVALRVGQLQRRPVELQLCNPGSREQAAITRHI